METYQPPLAGRRPAHPRPARRPPPRAGRQPGRLPAPAAHAADQHRPLPDCARQGTDKAAAERHPGPGRRRARLLRARPERVRLVAEEIAARTGLDVDITYGSSPAPQTVTWSPAGISGPSCASPTLGEEGRRGEHHHRDRPQERRPVRPRPRGLRAFLANAVSRRGPRPAHRARDPVRTRLARAPHLRRRPRRGRHHRHGRRPRRPRARRPPRRPPRRAHHLDAVAPRRADRGPAVTDRRPATGPRRGPRPPGGRPAPRRSPGPRRAGRPRGPLTMGLLNLVRVPGRTGLGAGALAIGIAAATVLGAITFTFHGAIVGTPARRRGVPAVRAVDTIAVAATILLGALAVADVLYLNIRDRAAELATLRATGWTSPRPGEARRRRGPRHRPARRRVRRGPRRGRRRLARRRPDRRPATAALTVAPAGALATLRRPGPRPPCCSRLPTAHLLAEEYLTMLSIEGSLWDQAGSRNTSSQ